MIFLAVFCFTATYAQTEKGKMMVGGSLGISMYKSDDGMYKLNTFGFDINPKFGYFVKKNFVMGANLSFSYDKRSFVYNNTGTYQFKSTTDNFTIVMGGGIFSRYYVPITDKFMFFANADLNYFYETTESKYTTTDTTFVFTDPNPQHTHGHNVSFSVSPGLVYFVTPKFGIEAKYGSLGVKYSTYKNITLPDAKKSSNFGANLNLSLSSFNFGLSYYF
jgi:hypothetical protein